MEERGVARRVRPDAAHMRGRDERDIRLLLFVEGLNGRRVAEVELAVRAHDEVREADLLEAVTGILGLEEAEEGCGELGLEGILGGRSRVDHAAAHLLRCLVHHREVCRGGIGLVDDAAVDGSF